MYPYLQIFVAEIHDKLQVKIFNHLSTNPSFRVPNIQLMLCTRNLIISFIRKGQTPLKPIFPTAMYIWLEEFFIKTIDEQAYNINLFFTLFSLLKFFAGSICHPESQKHYSQINTNQQLRIYIISSAIDLYQQLKVSGAKIGQLFLFASFISLSEASNAQTFNDHGETESNCITVFYLETKIYFFCPHVALCKINNNISSKSHVGSLLSRSIFCLDTV